MALIVLGAVVASAAPAWGHGSLVGGSPGPGDDVVPGSTVLRLEFAALDAGEQVQVALLDDRGDPLAVGVSSLADDGRTVCARHEPLAEGVHILEYVTLGADGHRELDRYLFTVSGRGVAATPGVCADVDLAAPTAAQAPDTLTLDTLAADTPAVDTRAADEQVSGWLIAALALLGVAVLGAFAARVRARRPQVGAR